MIRILAAEHSPYFLEILATLIEGQPDLGLVGTSSDGLETVEKTTLVRPDLLIMDGQLPRLNGAEATKRIKRSAPEVRILVFGSSPDDLTAGLAAGADGYLSKDCTNEELFEEIRRIVLREHIDDYLERR
jgi:DNA-binding NarL/FixJ family response regulator